MRFLLFLLFVVSSNGFADEEWVMNIEMLSQQVHGDHGVALVRTTYTDQAGPRQAMLSLHFTREMGEWRLFFDQNTRIASVQ